METTDTNLFGFDGMEQKKENNNKKTYSPEKVKVASVAYFNGSEKRANVWADKYALKRKDKEFYELTPDDMHHRIARELARIEKNYQNPMSEEQIYYLLKDFKYIVPQGGPMSGIGNDEQIVSLSNCFVIGNEKHSDSYGGIFKIDQEQVQLMKRRGGVGHDLSQLRPKNSKVQNSALTSTGMASFMERFSNSTKEVAQGGRRGALMLSVSVKHPDILDFIYAKTKTHKIDSANVSVRITDDFMKAVEEDRTYIQQFPVDSKKPQIIKEVKAREVFDAIVDAVYDSGDPGILFWDNIINESVPDCYADLGYKTISTNPCGEIPLCAYDSCRLLTINLYSYVVNPFTKNAYFDFDLLKEHSHYAHRFMDDIIDLEMEKIEAILEKIKSDSEDPEIKRVEKSLWENILKKTKEGRRSGLGHIGLADTLAALGIEYNSEKAIVTAVEIQKTYSIEIYRASVNLAKERGVFPIYDSTREQFNPFINRIKEADPELAKEMELNGRRNIALLTLAPTGTTSMVADVSSGVEPVYSIVSTRRINVTEDAIDKTGAYLVGEKWWKDYREFHPKFIEWAEINGYDTNNLLSETAQNIQEIISKSPYNKSTAYDLNYLFRVRLQGEIQKWVDHSISSTLNLKKDVSKTIIADAYLEAWKSKCKGLTIYRDGSKDIQVLEIEKTKTRPEVLMAEVFTFVNREVDWVAFIGLMDGKPYEIFTGPEKDVSFILDFKKLYENDDVEKTFTIKKETSKNEDTKTEYRFIWKTRSKTQVDNEAQGSFLISTLFNKEYWNYAILISCLMRYGIPIEALIKTVGKIKFEDDTAELNSWKSGVRRALNRFESNVQKTNSQKSIVKQSNEICPVEGCQEILSHDHGNCPWCSTHGSICD
ncbi:MAG: adenosylcobalamin-dependent ribonucleoside-diphosphate reductase [Bacteroidales bacterium]|jgi:ribonucleoside-diphosphate reductase alpha chain|nr:adenosylcobalamin-dependent ribonucleoside-diphosphate reductase [Bacteroidales bacterium]